MSANVHAGFGAGKFRKPWRIREFLDAQGVRQVDIARKLGISPSVVNRTIRGAVNNRAVLRHLRGMGCPEKILSLPEDLKNGLPEQDKKQVA